MQNNNVSHLCMCLVVLQAFDRCAVVRLLAKIAKQTQASTVEPLVSKVCYAYLVASAFHGNPALHLRCSKVTTAESVAKYLGHTCCFGMLLTCASASALAIRF